MGIIKPVVIAILLCILSACAKGPKQSFRMESGESAQSAGISLVIKWEKENVRSISAYLEKDGSEAESLIFHRQNHFQSKSVLRGVMSSQGCVVYLLIGDPGDYVVRLEIEDAQGDIAKRGIKILKAPDGELKSGDFYDIP